MEGNLTVEERQKKEERKKRLILRESQLEKTDTSPQSEPYKARMLGHFGPKVEDGRS